MSDPSLRPYEEGPYLQGIAAAITEVRAMEAAMRSPLLAQDAAEVAVGAFVRRLVADGQLPALGTNVEPAMRRRLPNSHRRAVPNAAPPKDLGKLESARRALGG